MPLPAPFRPRMALPALQIVGYGGPSGPNGALSRRRHSLSQSGRELLAQHDMKDASATYAGFINLAKYGAIIAALAAALVIVLIS